MPPATLPAKPKPWPPGRIAWLVPFMVGEALAFWGAIEADPSEASQKWWLLGLFALYAIMAGAFSWHAARRPGHVAWWWITTLWVVGAQFVFAVGVALSWSTCFWFCSEAEDSADAGRLILAWILGSTTSILPGWIRMAMAGPGSDADS